MRVDCRKEHIAIILYIIMKTVLKASISKYLKQRWINILEDKKERFDKATTQERCLTDSLSGK